MRVFLTAAVLFGAALVGYLSSRTVSAQNAVFSQAGITQGDKVRLTWELDRGAQECTVIAIRGDFIGCRNERQTLGSTGYTRWYNLRLIVRIDRPGQD
jgi:hypothetical protein